MPSTSPTTFFGWVVFLLEQYGPLFLRGAGMTMLIAISGTILGFLIGLLVGIARTIELGPRAPIWKRALVRLLNAVLGVLQESKAEAAIEALQTMTAATCKVLRDGKMAVLHSDELVPGDVVLLEAGDAVRTAASSKAPR